MAGYLFLLDSAESLRECVETGTYSTILSAPDGRWLSHHEATFADYVTMRPGDNVYFFIKRNIYGIGTIVNIEWQAGEGVQRRGCKFANYPNACQPQHYDYNDVRDNLLKDWGESSPSNRWLCTFVPAPHFFINGIDMDDVLASNPSAFRMLRVIQNVSFIKFDDEENQAFRDVILKTNRLHLSAPATDVTVYRDAHGTAHAHIQERLSRDDYSLSISPFLTNSSDGDKIRHEMAIEAALLYQLSAGDPNTVDVFGQWDYLSHQVVASPFKPVVYMDKMDVFGYSYIANHAPTKGAYLVGEIKKDDATAENVEQLMKYVDWVKDEYCHNDYSLVKAFLIAYDFADDVVAYKTANARRRYSIGRRPSRPMEWSSLRLIKYRFDNTSGRLRFHDVG